MKKVGFLKVSISKLLEYLLQGLVIITPVTITILTIAYLFNVVNDLLPKFLHAVLPEFLQNSKLISIERIPGLGFIIIIAILIFIGWISSIFFFGKIIGYIGGLLEKTPGAKIVYSAVKDFMKAFSGNKRKFDQAVLVCIEQSDIWRVGFITQTELSRFELQEYMSVYVPQSYGIAGNVYLLPKYKIKVLNQINAGDAMKFVISGGLAFDESITPKTQE
ncbi:MAG: DUF502 domain-containing protein [Phycisphaerales bacterium]|nr:DUF502 domain-containing protein [Phycisphaerales bacterium]